MTYFFGESWVPSRAENTKLFNFAARGSVGVRKACGACTRVFRACPRPCECSSGEHEGAVTSGQDWRSTW